MPLVGLIGLIRARGTHGYIYALDALALLACAITWSLLGAAWAKGRPEGRLLRVFTWLALGLPVLGVVAVIGLLLVFKPRLF